MSEPTNRTAVLGNPPEKLNCDRQTNASAPKHGGSLRFGLDKLCGDLLPLALQCEEKHRANADQQEH